MEEFFRNEPIRNKNCLWWPCLLTDRDEMCNLYRGPSIDVFLPSFGSFGQVVSEKIFLNRPIRNKELPLAAMFLNRSGQNERSLERTIHRCFLPSFNSFGREVLEEKIKMWKVNGRQTDAKWWQKLTLPLARWAKNNTDRNIYICTFFFFEWKQSCAGFLLFVYSCIFVENPIIKTGFGIPLTGLTPSHFCACPNPRPGFPTSNCVVSFVLNCLRWEVVVHLLILMELLTMSRWLFKCSSHNLNSFVIY